MLWIIVGICFLAFYIGIVIGLKSAEGVHRVLFEQPAFPRTTLSKAMNMLSVPAMMVSLSLATLMQFKRLGRMLEMTLYLIFMVGVLMGYGAYFLWKFLCYLASFPDEDESTH
jgi:hypothetical protein